MTAMSIPASMMGLGNTRVSRYIRNTGQKPSPGEGRAEVVVQLDDILSVLGRRIRVCSLAAGVAVLEVLDHVTTAPVISHPLSSAALTSEDITLT